MRRLSGARIRRARLRTAEPDQGSISSSESEASAAARVPGHALGYLAPSPISTPPPQKVIAVEKRIPSREHQNPAVDASGRSIFEVSTRISMIEARKHSYTIIEVKVDQSDNRSQRSKYKSFKPTHLSCTRTAEACILRLSIRRCCRTS